MLICVKRSYFNVEINQHLEIEYRAQPNQHRYHAKVNHVKRIYEPFTPEDPA